MKENVGSWDRILRGLTGPGLLALGYFRMRGREGRLPGLIAMMGGALITETAVTRVCPLNRMLGLDTRRGALGWG
jgi:hypothetical protein